MATYTATSTSQLLADLKTAGSGDTILLAPGTYSGVLINGLAKTGVTVTSADPNNEAQLTDLTVKGSSGLTFSNLDLYATTNTPFAIEAGSSNITLTQLNVHGLDDGNPADDVSGLIVRESANVVVSNSAFHNLSIGLTHSDTTGVTFSGNSFTAIRDDAIDGGGSSNIVIANNTFTNFDHTGTVHPDAIQFWTANTTGSASNIVITGNVIDVGSGTPVQGIFMTDASGVMPYQNVTVSDNVVIGEMFNGIALMNINNLTVDSNIVAAQSGQTSWLALEDDTSATFADNIASYYNLISSSETGSGDVLSGMLDAASVADLTQQIQAGADSGASLYASVRDDLLGNISLIGYVDGPSTTGESYSFDTVNLVGTSGNDVLRAGNVGSYHLYGGDGNDSLVGGTDGLPTILEGGNGDDTYIIYQTQDVVVEQPNAGNDVIYTFVDYTMPANVETMRAMASGLTLTGGAGADYLVSAAGGDTLIGGGGNDTLQGGTGDDTLVGGVGNARLVGSDGDDVISVVGGNNYLSGGNGNDTLIAGAGNDTLDGGPGMDVMHSGTGPGATVFVFRSSDFAAGLAASEDTIVGFNAAKGDLLNIAAVDANAATTAIDAFKFIGNQPFHDVAGELRYAADGDGITLYGDTNGDGVADIAIHLSGVTTIAASNMIL